MSRVTVKNLPRLKLADLLRRRKMTLDGFIIESGVQTYEALVIRCDRLGCLPPTEQEYKKLRPNIVSSPSDGVVVLEPLPVIDEQTGRRIDPDAPVTIPGVSVITEKNESLSKDGVPDGGTSGINIPAPTGSRRVRRTKKESLPTE